MQWEETSLPSSPDSTRGKGGWLTCAHVCLTILHWLLEEHRMRAWLLNHLKSCSAQFSQNCGQCLLAAKAEHCLQCFSSWPPCDTHTPPPPNLLRLFPDCSLFFLPTLIKPLLEIYMLIRVIMIVSMQIRPNLHFKLQGVTLSSSMDFQHLVNIFFSH